MKIPEPIALPFAMFAQAFGVAREARRLSRQHTVVREPMSPEQHCAEGRHHYVWRDAWVCFTCNHARDGLPS